MNEWYVVLEAAFESCDFTRAVKRQLLKLKQGRSEFYSYNAKSQKIVANTKYDEQALISNNSRFPSGP